jgi:N-acyl homoserine lactone hydrolase
VNIEPEAFLIKPGSMVRDPSGEIILDARSSVTLVISGGKRILIDTGLAGEEPILIERLARRGLEPSDVNVVINTHEHDDHRGCNHLFLKAEKISPETAREGDFLGPGVQVLETPGHTRDCISVLICSPKGRVIAAGDAIPLLGNYLKLVPPRHNIDRELAMSSLFRIVNLADVVVPGHDRPFLVNGKRYTSLLD